MPLGTLPQEHHSTFIPSQVKSPTYYVFRQILVRKVILLLSLDPEHRQTSFTDKNSFSEPIPRTFRASFCPLSPAADRTIRGHKDLGFLMMQYPPSAASALCGPAQSKLQPLPWKPAQEEAQHSWASPLCYHSQKALEGEACTSVKMVASNSERHLLLSPILFSLWSCKRDSKNKNKWNSFVTDFQNYTYCLPCGNY